MRISFRRIIFGILLLLGLPLLWVHLVKEIGNNSNNNNRNVSGGQRTNLLDLKTVFLKTKPTTTKAVLVRGLSSSIDHNDQLEKKGDHLKGPSPSSDKSSNTAPSGDLKIKYTEHIINISVSMMKQNDVRRNQSDILRFTDQYQRSTSETTPIPPRSKIVIPPPKEDCLHLEKTIPNKDQVWQPVTEDRSAFVFSAFLDDLSGGRIIRIIGMRSRALPPNLFCQIWFDENNTENYTKTERVPRYVVVAATLRLIPEDHGRKYTSCYFLCPLHQFSFKAVPSSISVVSKNKCAKSFNHIAITPNWPTEKVPKKEFTLCISPLHFNYSRAYELVEWMEINQLFGADYFVFYNETVRSNVQQVLQQYIKEGIAETVQWHMPVNVDTWPQKSSVEIHYFGQLAAINDCLYRNLYKSKYLVFMDVDEFIVPRNHKNWPTMFANLKDKYNIGAYVFKCSFFRKEWEDTPRNFSGKNLALIFRAVTLLKLNRESKIHPMFIRSKIIVQPLRVETMGIHNIWAFRPGYQPIEIGQTQALLHHYRNWYNPNTSNRVYDDTMLKFKDDILHRLINRWKKLKNVPLEIQ